MQLDGMETHGIVGWLLQENKIVFLSQEFSFNGLEIAGIVGWAILVLEIVLGILITVIRKYGHPRLWCNGRKLGRGPAVHGDAPINRPTPEAVEAARVRPTPEAVEAARYLADPPTVDLLTAPTGPTLLDLFDETCASYMAPPRSNPFI